MQGEFGEVLRDERDHTGVMRARGDFAENHLVTANKQLHAEEAIAAQRQDGLAGDRLRAFQRQGAHLLRLPGFAVIAIFLTVANRVTEMNAVHGADGQQGDLEIKLHNTFNDHTTGSGATTLLGIIPRLVQRAAVADKALPFTGGAHYRLNDARVADLLDGPQECGFIASKTVARRRQPELLRRQATDPFAVHGELCGFCTGHHALAFLLKGDQRIGSDGFNFRHHKIRFFTRNQFAKGIAIQHVNHIRTMGEVHGGCISVAVNGNDFHA